MVRLALVPLFSFLCAAVGSAQEKPPEKPGERPADRPSDKPADPAGAKGEPGKQGEGGEAAAQPILDSNPDAVKLLREKSAALADKEPRVRAQALETFLVHRHETYVKPIAALLKDKNGDVAKLAARALGNQPFPSSSDALLDFATHPKNFEGKPEIACEAILALGSAGLGKKGYDRLREIFDDGDKAVKTAIFRALAAQKEKKAFSLFVDHCDEPAPANPNSPSNPPASYWKARFEEWQEYKQYVRQGLKAMTGESLATSRQYVEWANGPGKKLGFVYRSGG
jgi:hypothetical protein